MSYKVRQKDIRDHLRCGAALPLADAESLVKSGERSYFDFSQVCYSAGIYGINGLVVEDQRTGQMYAEASRSTRVFYFA